MTEGTKTFEDRIFEAVVEQFFAPQWQSVTVFNPNTNQSEQVMQQLPSPAARIANDIFSAQHDAILLRMKESVSIDAIAEALAEKVTNDVVQRLSPPTSIWNDFDRDREQMRKRVNERIADELARRALEKMDAEQADADATS